MRESRIETTVCAHAKGNDWLSLKVQQRGWPDRLFLKDGGAVFVEFKAPNQKPRPMQKHIIQQLQKKGFRVHVIDSIEAGCALFQ